MCECLFSAWICYVYKLCSKGVKECARASVRVHSNCFIIQLHDNRAFLQFPEKLKSQYDCCCQQLQSALQITSNVYTHQIFISLRLDMCDVGWAIELNYRDYTQKNITQINLFHLFIVFCGQIKSAFVPRHKNGSIINIYGVFVSSVCLSACRASFGIALYVSFFSS